MTDKANEKAEKDEISDFLKLFYALDSKTRLNIIQSLFENEKHISEIAREQSISVPVAAKHVNILEDANLVTRNIYGKTHVLQLNNKDVARSLDVLAPIKTVEIKKGTNLLDILKDVVIIETKKLRGKEHVISTNGDKGFFIYEIDGQFCDQTVQNCVFRKDTTVVWKKLEPVAKLRLNIKVKDQ
ncbi:ArsR/SmtB family transcription factor [Methanolobus profundi]|uniref:Regulatory protein, arsR family n=1 Tax=Methanolobus profundi TaxID=487685 RepID=A0A1I4PF58_9EURY|nr:winged helix-turn-helix domain-containing protein [Methanolobus profundi]SFM26327.1 regulatory protein, arsR family [Methanolobus profundi]